MARYPLAGKRVWLTGASSGIGRALALELAARGARVALSARGVAALETLAGECGGGALALPLDVTDRAANLACAGRLEQHFGGVDLVIFNAGTCEYVDVAAFDGALFERQMQTNLLSVVYGIEAALPLLRRSATPYLVGVSSLTADAPLPRAQAYGASKAALAYLLRALRVDLVREGIPVSVVYPGFVRTPLTDRNDFPMPFLLEVDDAARRIARGLERQRPELRFPWPLAVAVRALGALPARIGARLAARLSRA